MKNKEIIEILKKCVKTIEEQERLIKLLELKLSMRNTIPPVIVTFPNGTQPCHFHGGIPCYQNPCVWC